MTVRPQRAVVRLVLALAVLGGLAGAVLASGLRWQHTESLPRGLYRVDRHAPIRRGSIVLWCLDAARGTWARRRGYLTRGPCPGQVEVLGKVVLGVPGDTIDWAPAGVRVNGTVIGHTPPLLRDGVGRRLIPVPFGRYVLPSGRLWLFSPRTARSLDSRYFGPVPVPWIRAVVVRLF